MLFKNNNGIYKILKDDGFNISINNHFFGGYTIKNILIIITNKASSIQIELGNKIRFNEEVKDAFIKSLAYGIKNYINKWEMDNAF